jgi:hypothetical protein
LTLSKSFAARGISKSAPVNGTMTSTDNNLGVASSTQVVQLSGTATVPGRCGS